MKDYRLLEMVVNAAIEFIKIKNDQMKNLKITAPKGYEIDKVNSTFENIVFKSIKKELPKSWEELEKIKGFYIEPDSEVSEEPTVSTEDAQKNIFATKGQAEASLALAQLSQLREVYRDGWKPNWNMVMQDKYCITIMSNEITTVMYNQPNKFLSFQSEEVRDLFLKNFRDLIEQAKPLLS